MITIKDGPNFSKLYAKVAFDEWGRPTQEKINVVELDNQIEGNSIVHDANDDIECDFSGYVEMIENTLWIFNNDPFKIRESEVFMTGAGVNWMFQKGPVQIYDISKTQVKFVQSLLDTWDGNNYGAFVYDFIIKNKVRHFHVNLNEQQDTNRSLIKNKINFISSINGNFKMLVEKYDQDWRWDPTQVKVTCGDLVKQIPKNYIGKFLLTNIFDFKYYFVKCFVDDAHDLISPSTKMFIKNIDKITTQKDQPPCVEKDLQVPVEQIQKEIEQIKDFLVPHRHESGLGWKSFCIHGQNASRTKEDKYYKNFLGYKWTDEALEHMPATIAWLKTLGYKNFQRVRVMCLDPKGFINVHKDQTHSGLGPVSYTHLTLPTILRV